ncbi:MAG: prolipoprotein diacylglyceryl transferase [Tenacibaculum sp.]|nr:prolipoprotein diacylglyceryl transferase [Tenacibaculum sp.]
MNFLAVDWFWDPEMFNLWGISVRWYSFMFIVAFLSGINLTKKMYRADGIPTEKVDPLFTYVFFSMLIGMRLGDVFFYSWDYYQNHLLEIFLPIKESAGSSTFFGLLQGYKFTGFTGLASHGAAITIPIALYFYNKKYLQKSWLFILDRLCIMVAMAGFFIRMGNFFNSEIYGKPTDASFGIIFSRAGEVVPRHPTQLYEAFSYLMIFLVLWFIFWDTYKRHREGYLFGLFMMSVWGLRFLIEYVKEPQVEGREDIILGLNTGQLLSIPLILIGVYLFFRKPKTA